MAHYAKVVDGIVTEVIVADSNFIEKIKNETPGEWIQTSYNTRRGIHFNPETGQPSDDQSKALRKNYAGFGYTYDKVRDAFIPPKPYSSWLLNEETCNWYAPVDYPSDRRDYIWNEEEQQWDVIN
jgi:hypothetical protein